MKKNQYWNDNTDLNIKIFLLETDPDKREQIFREKIYNCLRILSEVSVSKYGQNLDRDDTIHECISHLYQVLINHVDFEKKDTAYSYLTRSAFNFVMQENSKMYKKKNTHISIDVPITDSDSDNDANNIIDIHEYKKINKSEYPDEFDFNEELFLHKLVEKIEKKDIDNIIKNAKNLKLVNKYALKKMIMMSMAYLGSYKFDYELRCHPPFKRFLKNNREIPTHVRETHMELLKNIANEIYPHM